MRYRALSPTGDYTFGRSAAEFLVNTPEAVAQAVMTRLLLATKQWFLDLTEGTPYDELILGKGTMTTYDAAIRERILDTNGVWSLDQYASSLDQERNLTVDALITTIYGQRFVPLHLPVQAQIIKGGRLNIDFWLNRTLLG